MSESNLKVTWTTPVPQGSAIQEMRKRMENVFRELYGEVLKQKTDPEELLRELEALEQRLKVVR